MYITRLQCSPSLPDETPSMCNTEPYCLAGIYLGAFGRWLPGVQNKIILKKQSGVVKMQENSHDFSRSRLKPYTMESSHILQDGQHHLSALLMSTALSPSYWEHQHGGLQDHVGAVLVGTVVRRSNHHAQKPSPFSAELSYLEKLFLGRVHSCPGTIWGALDCIHHLPATGRYL